MTTFADNRSALQTASPVAAMAPGRRFVVTWPCVRRATDAGRPLERVACVVALQALDQQHATIECWIEADGVRQRTVLHSTTRPCAIDADGRFAHVDMAAADGTRLLAMTMEPARERIIYAQTTLLRDAGLRGGTYDPPMLRPAPNERIAQSA